MFIPQIGQIEAKRSLFNPQIQKNEAERTLFIPTDRSEAKSVYSTNSKEQREANSAYSRNRQDPSEKNELDRSKTNRGGIFKTFMEPRNRFQGIDSTSLCPGGPVQQPYSSSVPSPILKLLKRLQIRAQATLDSGIGSLDRFLGSLNVYKYRLRLHWIAELVPWNRFLGSLNVYKYSLRLH